MNKPVPIKTISANLQPAISVLLPVYNGGDYLKQSLQSVLKQTLHNVEILIIDDCSTDGSFEYLQSVSDDRISLFKNEQNRGLFFNLNFLIEQSKSPLIKLWAQDDMMYPQCLERFVDFHAAHPGIGFSYSGRDMIDENGKIKKNDKVDNTPTIISTELHAKIAYYTGSIAGNIANVCIAKQALDKVGLFKEQMKISADFDMWVRLAEHFETGFINEKLIQLRDHDGQLSRNEKYYINHVKEDLEVYRYLDGYVSNNLKKEGHSLMQNNKLVFYYTLMLKALSKGDFKTFASYVCTLHSYTNIAVLTGCFFRNKFFSHHKPGFTV